MKLIAGAADRIGTFLITVGALTTFVNGQPVTGKNAALMVILGLISHVSAQFVLWRWWK